MLTRRVRDLFRRSVVDREFEAEAAFHLEQLLRDYMRSGLSAEEARRQAALEFGGREQINEDVRDVHRMPLIEAMIGHARSAVRFMRKSPGFSLAVIATLALGIGANSAVMSAIDAVLLRPLPFPQADRLVTVSHYNFEQRGANTRVAPVRLQDWSRMNSTFASMTGYYTDNATEISGELPEKVGVAYVAPRFCQVWGISPVAGRDFTADEYRRGGPSAALISERYARKRFGSAAAAVGRELRLDRTAWTVVGVLPEAFAFEVRDTDIWSPVPVDAPLTQRRELPWFSVVGRMKHGVTVAQAQADLAAVQARLGKAFGRPDSKLAVVVESLKEQTVGGVRRSLWMLFGAVTLLLLIACANVGALLLARTTDRAREIAIRFALGASRGSVAAQLLAETFGLALAGAAAGLAAAWILTRAITAMGSAVPRVTEIGINGRVLAYTLATAVATTILCGLLPALRVARRDLAFSMAQRGRSDVSGGGRLQWGLVGVQVALAVALLAGAGLLLRSFRELGRVSPGFDPSHILAFRVSGSWAETADMGGVAQRINRTLDTLRSMPGVEAAATAAMLPAVDGKPQVEFTLAERESEGKIAALTNFVSRGYFGTLRIPLMAGQDCEDSTRVDTALVNHSFAERFLNGASPIGYHVRVQDGLFLSNGRIVGVVGDAREGGLDKAPEPILYWCAAAPTASPTYLIRVTGNPAASVEAVRRKIHEIEPARSVFDTAPLERMLHDSFGEIRLRTVLLTLFAGTAISLACIGIYGCLSYVVAGRRREVGLRLALGAAPGEVLRRYVARGFGIAAAGCAVGVALALALNRALAGMLYGVRATDPATFAAVVALVLAVGAAASLAPAFRASRVDPATVLRDE